LVFFSSFLFFFFLAEFVEVVLLGRKIFNGISMYDIVVDPDFDGDTVDGFTVVTAAAAVGGVVTLLFIVLILLLLLNNFNSEIIFEYEYLYKSSIVLIHNGFDLDFLDDDDDDNDDAPSL
jgi:hypothetical protein